MDRRRSCGRGERGSGGSCSRTRITIGMNHEALDRLHAAHPSRSHGNGLCTVRGQPEPARDLHLSRCRSGVTWSAGRGRLQRHTGACFRRSDEGCIRPPANGPLTRSDSISGRAVRESSTKGEEMNAFLRFNGCARSCGMNTMAIVSLAAVMGFAGCTDTGPANPADTIFHGGPIVTVDDD